MSTLASGHVPGRPGHIGRPAGGECARRAADAATPALKDASSAIHRTRHDNPTSRRERQDGQGSSDHTPRQPRYYESLARQRAGAACPQPEHSQTDFSSAATALVAGAGAYVRVRQAP
ncbi:hypothetical protein TRAPUB_8091 [Trametes pubescens]|uniref:Uncharacterized protein n=1 Tax=Trametes pubescens TaxID=154538 RepID=A0A1M2W698_TRAPU|nr:hypothetical protein TRAPUB_8091 [Trametes pubescens]